MLNHYKSVSTHKINKIDSGFTLIELVFGLSIVGFISLFLLNITQQLSTSLNNVAVRAATAQSAIRFSNEIRYDVAGSQEVYVHGNVAPVASANKSCTTYNPNTDVWTAPTGNREYIRGLFTLRIAEIKYNRNSIDSPIWTQPTPEWVGYEVRQATYQLGSTKVANFELWRIFCKDNAGSPDTTNILSDERLLDLGPNTSARVFDGTFISCYSSSVDNTGKISDSVVDCRTGAIDGYDIGTASRVSYYKFALPYQGNVALLNTIKDPSFNELRRKLDF